MKTLSTSQRVNCLIVLLLAIFIIPMFSVFLHGDLRFGWGMYSNLTVYQIEYYVQENNSMTYLNPSDINTHIHTDALKSIKPHGYLYGIGSVLSMAKTQIDTYKERIQLSDSQKLIAKFRYQVNVGPMQHTSISSK